MAAYVKFALAPLSGTYGTGGTGGRMRAIAVYRVGAVLAGEGQ